MTDCGFCDPSDCMAEDVLIWVPVFNPLREDMSVDIAKYIVQHVGNRFCKLAEQEKLAMTWSNLKGSLSPSYVSLTHPELFLMLNFCLVPLWPVSTFRIKSLISIAYTKKHTHTHTHTTPTQTHTHTTPTHTHTHTHNTHAQTRWRGRDRFTRCERSATSAAPPSSTSTGCAVGAATSSASTATSRVPSGTTAWRAGNATSLRTLSSPRSFLATVRACLPLWELLVVVGVGKEGSQQKTFQWLLMKIST